MTEPYVYLMYHELELAGRPMVQSDPGYSRYVLSADQFRTQMQFVAKQGWRGMRVSDALTFPQSSGVAITFDDGCETDLLAAAPILQEHGFGATFYVTCGFLGRRGYMSHTQLRELSALGFEIGCHSMTHAYLTELDEGDLHREIAGPKQQLEQILGRPVEHFSCPGGRCSMRATEVARNAGYRSLATSRIHTNGKSTDSFALGRVAILRSTGLQSFSEICRGRGLGRLRMSYALRAAARGVVGNSVYESARGFLLNRRGRL